MFKYKSPLSRLLEGAGKAKESEDERWKRSPRPRPKPKNRSRLRISTRCVTPWAGGNISSESYEDSDELIPEEEMPEFSEGENPRHCRSRR